MALDLAKTKKTFKVKIESSQLKNKSDIINPWERPTVSQPSTNRQLKHQKSAVNGMVKDKKKLSKTQVKSKSKPRLNYQQSGSKVVAKPTINHQQSG